jgi:hypothetical protein
MTSRRQPSEPAVMAAIEAGCRTLRLPTIRDRSGEIAAAAEREQLTYLGFLAELVMAECDDRTNRRALRRVHDAGFPRPKRLEEFDFAANPAINPATIAQLAGGDWIRAGQPLCLVGDSGTGKTATSSKPAPPATASPTPEPADPLRHSEPRGQIKPSRRGRMNLTQPEKTAPAKTRLRASRSSQPRVVETRECRAGACSRRSGAALPPTTWPLTDEDSLLDKAEAVPSCATFQATAPLSELRRSLLLGVIGLAAPRQ